MKRTALASCITLGFVFTSACSADKDAAAQRMSRLEKRVQDGRVKICPLPDGSEFVLTAHAASLGRHDVFSSGRNGDAFATGFSPTYHGKAVATTLQSFTDDRPDCANYAISGTTLFALTDSATFRFMAANGRRGGSVLLVSRDGGLTFSDNLHPNAREKAQGNQAILDAFQQFGYYRSRFRTVDEQYQLEITNPLDFNDFLLFVSSDGGKVWTGPASSKDPTVFPAIEVEKWRTQFATNQWHNKVFKAKQEACKRPPELGCALATEAYWGPRWQACVQQHSARECLTLLPEPTARFSPN